MYSWTSSSVSFLLSLININKNIPGTIEFKILSTSSGGGQEPGLDLVAITLYLIFISDDGV